MAVSLAVEFAASDRGAESFHRGDFTCLPGDGQSEIPSAGVELQDAILFVKGAGVQEFGEHKAVGLGVDLGEGVGVEFERQVVLQRHRDRWCAPGFAPVAGLHNDTINRRVCRTDQLAAEFLIARPQRFGGCCRDHSLASLVAADDLDMLEVGSELVEPQRAAAR